MELSDARIGFALTGSFCTFRKTIDMMRKLKEDAQSIVPIMSERASSMDTKFGNANDFIEEIESIAENKIISDINGAERIGTGNLFDILLIAPCTGNTLAKLSNGITDSAVLMAAKAHLRNNKPVVLAVSSNDALGMNFQNIGRLMVVKNIYFVPFYQDDPVRKINSLASEYGLINTVLKDALNGIQTEPVIISK